MASVSETPYLLKAKSRCEIRRGFIDKKGKKRTWRCCWRSSSDFAVGRCASCSWKRSCSMLMMRGGNSPSVGRAMRMSSKKVDMSGLRAKTVRPPVSMAFSRVMRPMRWFRGRKPRLMVGSWGALVGKGFY